METFNALKEADEVKTFPNINMPPPVFQVHTGKTSYSKTKDLISTKKKKDTNPFPGLLKTNKSNILTSNLITSKNEKTNVFTGFDSNNIKLDVKANETQEIYNVNAFLNPPKNQNTDLSLGLKAIDLSTNSSLPPPSTRTNATGRKNNDTTLEELRNYIVLMDKYSLHNFLIYEGKTLRDTPEFQSFQRSYQYKWGGICSIIYQLEEFLANYDVKLAIVNGPRVYELARLGLPMLSKEDIYTCIANIEDIENLMNPDQEMSKKKLIAMVIKIQALVRMFLCIRRFRRELMAIKSAIKIQSVARLFIQRVQYIIKMRVKQLNLEEDYRQQRQRLKEWWKNYESKYYFPSNQTNNLMNNSENNLENDGTSQENHLSSGTSHAVNTVRLLKGIGLRNNNGLNSSERLIVYIPSLSISSSYLRLHLENLQLMQNTHINALYQLMDPNVTLIYVTPFNLSTYQMTYHEKLLALLNISILPKRLITITPEMSSMLPSHLSVAHQLYYSSQALNKIKFFVKKFQNNGMILSSSVSWVEKKISQYLQLPLLNGDNHIVETISSRSFVKENIYMKQYINIPIGAHDIYSHDDLFLALTRLISCNLAIQKWKIKLNYDHNYESTIIMPVDKLSVIKELRQEQMSIVGDIPPDMNAIPLISNNNTNNNNDPENKSTNPQLQQLQQQQQAPPSSNNQELLTNLSSWYGQSIQLAVRKKILNCLKKEFLPKIIIGRKDIFPDWESYCKFIRIYGAVVEAEPIEPLGVVTSIGFISPLGEIFIFPQGIECIMDDVNQIQGYIYPQQITSPLSLLRASEILAKQLYETYEIIGYLQFQFQSFWDAIEQKPRLVAMDIKFGHSTLHSIIGNVSILCQQDPLFPNQTTMNRTTNETEGSTTTQINNSTTGSFPGINSTQNLPLHLIPPIPEGRSFVYIPLAVHEPLKSTHDDNFFKLCKLRGIAFDYQHKLGTLFFLVDSILSGAVSVLCLGRNHRKSLETGINTLNFIQKNYGMDKEAILYHQSESLTRILLNLKKIMKKQYPEVSLKATM